MNKIGFIDFASSVIVGIVSIYFYKFAQTHIDNQVLAVLVTLVLASAVGVVFYLIKQKYL